MTIDALVVLLYLIITIYIGVKASKRLQKAQDYITFDQKPSTPILTATLIATIIGGGYTMGTAAKIYSIGLAYVLISFGTTITHLISAKYVVHHFEKFKNASSIGDIIGFVYGEKAKIITGIIGFIKCFGSIGGQILAMSYLLESLLGLPIKLGILINAGVVITYSALGGVRAVTATDIFQFILLVTIIPIISSVSVSKVGGLSELINQIPKDKLVIHYDEIWNYLALFIMFCMPYLAPHIVHKYLMADNVKAIKKALYSAATVDFTLTITMSVISFATLITNNTLQADSVIPYVISEILPPVVRGLAISGMLAVIMSTTDSILHATTITIVNDILPIIRRNYTETFKIWVMVITTFVIGILAVCTAWTANSILDIIIYYGGLYLVTITVPLWIALRKGEKINPKAFYVSIISSLSTVIILDIILNNKFHYVSIVIGLIANFISLVLVGDLKEYKIHFIKHLYTGNISTAFLYKLKRKLRLEQNILDSVRNFIRQKANINDAQYTLFAIYGCVSYILPYLFFPSSKIQANGEVIIFRLISGILCLLLLIKDYWPLNLQKYMPIYWYIVLLICLPVNTTFLFFLENGSIEWLLNMALSIFILSFLIDWLSFIILTALGAILGSILFFSIVGGTSVDFGDNKLLLLVYMTSFSALIGLFFGRHKEVISIKRVENLKTLAGAIAHEVITPLTAISLQAEKINHSSDNEIKNNIISYVSKSKLVISSILMNIQDNPSNNNISSCSIAECIKETLNVYPFSRKERNIISISIAQDFLVKIDKIYLMQIFFNLIRNSIYYTKYKKGPEIKIHIDDGVVKFFDNGVGMNQETVIHIFKPFFTRRKGGAGIGLSFCKMVMESIGGHIECRSIEGEFTEFTLRFV